MNDLPEPDETEYLLRSPKNAARLLAALAWSEAGEGIPQTIEELMADAGFDEYERACCKSLPVRS